MKILYSLPHPSHRLDDETAGHIIRAKALIRALRDAGNEVIIDQAARSGSQPAVNTYRQLVRKLIPRPIAMNIRDRGRVVFGRQYGERLTNAVRQHQPDVILQTHIAFSLSGAIAATGTGVPLVLDDVTPSWEEQQQYGVGSQELAEETHRTVTQAADMCVAVSEPMRRFLVEDGIREEKLVTVPNAITAANFDPRLTGDEVRAHHGIPADAFVIVFVGSFQPYQRVDLLLRAFAAIQTGGDFRLLLVGSGREEGRVQAVSRHLGMSHRVIFTGRISYKDIPRYIAAGNIAAMPATNTYGNPMKIYEYMAMGKAVVAPDQETITEIGTHNHDVYLFEPESIESMAAALDHLIHNPALREQLGQQAIQTVQHEHTWRARAATLTAAMEDMLAVQHA